MDDRGGSGAAYRHARRWTSFEDSGQLFPGDTYVVRFDAPGAYAYLCTLHPFMTGTVTVAPPAPSATVAPTPSTPPSPGTASVGPSPAPAASPPAADPVGASADGLPVLAVVLAAAAAAGVVGGIASWRHRSG